MKNKTDDEIVTIGAPFPKIASIAALPGVGFLVLVKWEGASKPMVVDLATPIHAFKLYAPLLEDRALFESVHTVNRSVVAWGADDGIDMHVSEIERLACEQSATFDFAGFIKEMRLTWDSAAALLGLSRRMVGYYAAGREIPRTVVLACKYLKHEHLERAADVVRPTNRRVRQRA